MNILEVKDYNHIDPINRYAITWEINNLCNYNCAYCDLHGTSLSLNPFRVVDFINYVGTQKNVKLTLFGGEPTLHPDILPVLKKLSVSVEMYTNLSKDLDFYDNLINIKPDIELEVSFHPSKENFDIFYSKVLYLSTRVCKLEIVYMLDSDYSDYRENYSKLKHLQSTSVSSVLAKIECFYQKPLSKEDENWYLNEQKGRDIRVVYLDDQGKKRNIDCISNFLFSRGLNNFKFFKCGCGLYNIFISHDGFVYPCLDYRRKEIKPYFNIQTDYKNKFKEISDKGIICGLDKCTSEIGVPKKRVLFLK